MGLQIKSLAAAVFATTSRDPLATSMHAGMVEQRFMMVRLETEDGTLGFGEAAATPFITGETLETMLAVVRGEIAPLLKGHDIRDVQGMHRRLDRLFPTGNRSAISAVDMAVHDALGQALGVPVSVLLGGAPAGEVESSRAISTGPALEMAAAARRNLAAGYRTIKIKVGADAASELVAIRAIREESGPELRIKLDANQGWTFAEAARFLEAAERFDIHVIEQPLKAGDLRGSAELRRRATIPVMLDEGIHSPADALRAIGEGACDYINIKLLKSGGLYYGAQIAAIARAAGVGCQIGTLSTSIGSAAAIHLIHAHPVISLPEVTWPDRLVRNPASGFAVKNGRASIPEAPGIGLVVEDSMRTGHEFI